MCVQIVDRPRHVHTSPVLSDRPISAEKASAVDMLKMFEEILIRDPKYLEDNEPSVESCPQVQRTPSLPNWWLSLRMRSGVHSSDPSLHGPSHSFLPHGFLSFRLVTRVLNSGFNSSITG